jgi:hypothetical protein
MGETHLERLARYQRKAHECRDRAARTGDVQCRLDLTSFADADDLLAELEEAGQAKLLRPHGPSSPA